ncbi:MAG: hypothetical protein CMF31_04885 [Kordiimonas sp.]|nr:hypothetical protein [Kordiimonas sp.]
METGFPHVVRCCLIFFSLLFLTGCGGSPSKGLLEKYQTTEQTPAAFGVCKGYGCTRYLRINMTAEEWQSVLAAFDPAPEDAAAERRALAVAVSRIEQIVGPKTNTENDAPGAQIVNLNTSGQMDCIDEAFNTTTYLNMLSRAGMLRWHRVGHPLRRGYVFDGWPHNTATIHEKNSDNDIEGPGHYVVDSWFHGNGIAPEIVPASQWAEGWSPQTVRP